jgi:hypothetical protein
MLNNNIAFGIPRKKSFWYSNAFIFFPHRSPLVIFCMSVTRVNFYPIPKCVDFFSHSFNINECDLYPVLGSSFFLRELEKQFQPYTNPKNVISPYSS